VKVAARVKTARKVKEMGKVQITEAETVVIAQVNPMDEEIRVVNRLGKEILALRAMVLVAHQSAEAVTGQTKAVHRVLRLK